MDRLTDTKQGISTKEEIEREIKSQGECNNVSLKRYVKLAEYEDLEEQGLLIKLPHRVGQKYYRTDFICTSEFSDNCERECDFCPYYKLGVIEETLGISVFLTREEAEKSLKTSI